MGSVRIGAFPANLGAEAAAETHGIAKIRRLKVRRECFAQCDLNVACGGHHRASAQPQRTVFRSLEKVKNHEKSHPFDAGGERACYHCFRSICRWYHRPVQQLHDHHRQEVTNWGG